MRGIKHPARCWMHNRSKTMPKPSNSPEMEAIDTFFAERVCHAFTTTVEGGNTVMRVKGVPNANATYGYFTDKRVRGWQKDGEKQYRATAAAAEELALAFNPYSEAHKYNMLEKGEKVHYDEVWEGTELTIEILS